MPSTLYCVSFRFKRITFSINTLKNNGSINQINISGALIYNIVLVLFMMLTPIILKAQSQPIDRILPKEDSLPTTRLSVDGRFYEAIITKEGDTLILADLDDISVTSFRTFDNDEDYQKYMRFRRYAATVFPYAKEAIRIFREFEYAKQYMSKRDQKKKIKELEEQLTKEFEEPLTRLTKLQGKIMIKMIEKELDTSMYDLIKGFKGSFKAFYWNGFSKLYSYDLKEGYNEGDYYILDAVLEDFELTYRIENESSMKYIKLEDLKKRRK